MDIRPLTLGDQEAWADLLAVAFDRTPQAMQHILANLHTAYRVVAQGAWDGDRLAAQYSCLITALHIPQQADPLPVGLCVNMAVHPDYRGQGLIKHIARPVYAELADRGCAAGVGFSNADGVRVDQRSHSYGYRVIGRMVPALVLLTRRPPVDPLALVDHWPGAEPHAGSEAGYVRFIPTPESLSYRFNGHSTRPYRFGVGEPGEIVAYRPLHWGRLGGAALLAAYGGDPVVARWAAAVWDQDVRLVQVLTSPGAPLIPALRRVGHVVRQPYTRSPYYLTAKPLHDDAPSAVFDFARWDCIGGDIL